MKKRFCIILLLLVSTQFFGQKTKKDEGIVFGLKGGLNVSNFSGDITHNSNRTSIHIGLFSEIIMSDNFSLQPELLYSGQGFSGSDTPGFSRSKYDYINIPVLAKIYLSEKLSIEAGPQIGFLISAKEKTEVDKLTISNQKTVDFGLNLGFAYDLKNGVFFQTRYNLGISNVNAGSNEDAIKYTNSVVQLSVGIKL
jgi:Outer membrane protein beta-barrel domain